MRATEFKPELADRKGKEGRGGSLGLRLVVEEGSCRTDDRVCSSADQKAGGMTSVQLGGAAGICLSCAFARGQPFLKSTGLPEVFPFPTAGNASSLHIPPAKGPEKKSIPRVGAPGVRAHAQSSQSQGPRSSAKSHDHASSMDVVEEAQRKTGKGTDFMRFKDMGEAGTELQTAIVTYSKQGDWWEGLVGRRPLEVDLVACVHIADKSYYQGLQEEFKRYDRVLYEVRRSSAGLVVCGLWKVWIHLAEGAFRWPLICRLGQTQGSGIRM